MASHHVQIAFNSANAFPPKAPNLVLGNVFQPPLRLHEQAEPISFRERLSCLALIPLLPARHM